MPNDDGGVAAKLAGAKKALEAVNNSNVSPKSSPFAPGHEFSHAPYSMVKKPNPAPKPVETGITKEASDAGEGVKSRLQQQDAVNKDLSGTK